MNSRLIEKKVGDFLKNVFKSQDSINNKQLQRKKFDLLSKLVADLFNHKNSRVCFNNISNLIILILNIYIDKFPIDIFSLEKENSQKMQNSKYKQILKEEFLIK